MKNFAHRGFSGVYPENTMLAFSKAVELGVDGIELDVHFTKDQKLVIIHDETLIRTSGKKGSTLDYTLDEITKIEANLTHPEHKGTFIPSFEEYCDFISKTDVVTNVEIKTDNCYYLGIEEAVKEMIEKYKLTEKVIISSFNWLSVVKFKKICPHIECGLLREGHHTSFVGSLAKSLGFEYYHPDFKFLNEETVKECFDNGIGINTWTVNKQEDILRMKELGVTACISNFPDLVSASLK